MAGWIILALAILSGTFGRMGGSDKYNGKWRDWGCSLLVVLAVIVILGWKASFWWVYVLIFCLNWWFLSTYWDWLFGEDNHWFSGFMVGVGLSPILIIDDSLLMFVVGRAIALCIIWGCLNKFLPLKVFIWRRDVAEEFLRYFVSL